MHLFAYSICIWYDKYQVGIAVVKPKLCLCLTGKTLRENLQFLERHHGENYNCVEADILSVQIFPGHTERAEVTARVHLSRTPPFDVPAVRVDIWEFMKKDGEWRFVLHK